MQSIQSYKWAVFLFFHLGKLTLNYSLTPKVSSFGVGYQKLTFVLRLLNATQWEKRALERVHAVLIQLQSNLILMLKHNQKQTETKFSAT